MNANEYIGKNRIADVDSGGKRYRGVYNNTGSAIANGAIKVLTELFVSGKGLCLVPIAPATNVELVNEIGICANNTGGTIPDGEFGWFLVKGPYGSLAEGYGASTSGTVTVADQLEILTTATAFIDSGGVTGGIILGETCAIPIENVTTNVWAVYLPGRLSAVKSI